MAKLPSKTVNEILRDLSIRHSVFLEQYSNGEVRAVIEYLNTQVEPDILARITRYAGKEFTQKRLMQVQKEIRKVIEDGYAELYRRQQDNLVSLGKVEAKWQTASLSQTVPFAVSLTAPSVAVIRDMIRTRPIDGVLLKDWFEKLPADTVYRINRQITLGVIEGEGIDEIVRRIKGTRAAQYSDGILNTSRSDLRYMVRTAVGEVSHNVRRETYQENADIIKTVSWVATLDTRTCLFCIELEKNGPYAIDEVSEKPHGGCRCSTAPNTKSWKELGIDAKDAPPSTRASMNGQVAMPVDIEDWFADLSATDLRETFGKQKAEWFKEGKIEIADMVDDQNHIRTLEQLEALIEKRN